MKISGHFHGDVLGIYWGYTVHLEPKKTSLFGFLLPLFVVLRYAYHKPKKLLSSVCRVGGSSPRSMETVGWTIMDTGFSPALGKGSVAKEPHEWKCSVKRPFKNWSSEASCGIPAVRWFGGRKFQNLLDMVTWWSSETTHTASSLLFFWSVHRDFLMDCENSVRIIDRAIWQLLIWGISHLKLQAPLSSRTHLLAW